VAEVGKDLESITAMSKEQKDEINSLTAQLDSASTSKSELETEITTLKSSLAETQSQIEKLEADKVRYCVCFPCLTLTSYTHGDPSTASPIKTFNYSNFT